MRAWTHLTVLVLVLLLALYPLSRPSTYALTLLIILFEYIVLAQSYDILGGYLGYMNLGHSAFYGIAAYVFGIALLHQVPVALAFVLATASCVLFAALIAYPFFRLRGAYFALATFGMVLLLETIAFNWEAVTQGTAGISLPPQDTLVPSYYLGLLMTVATIGATILIFHSKFGLALRSIRDDEEAAATFGIYPFKYKCLALILSAVFPAIMGCVFLWHQNYIHPSSVLGLEIALLPIAMAMFGGSGAVLGPVVGAVVLTLIEELLWTRLPYFHLASYGAIFVLVGLFMPGGMVRSTPCRALLRRAGLEAYAT